MPPPVEGFPSVIPIDPDPPPLPQPSSPSTGFLWKHLFSETSVQGVKPPSRTYLSDGTPVVTAPSSVIFSASQSWSGHLLCQFLGDPPSPAKIFADLNPIWGRSGEISVKRFSEGTILIFIPSASTRRRVLAQGLWSSGTVSFTVSEWSSSTSLRPSKLCSAPTILTFRGVPPQLWSQEGIETIAEGVATLIPNTRASLPLSSLGTATIRAIVPLGPNLSPTVIVKDSDGGTVSIGVSYGRLPPKCPTCDNFGHLAHRCPARRTKNKLFPSVSVDPSSSHPVGVSPNQRFQQSALPPKPSSGQAQLPLPPPTYQPLKSTKETPATSVQPRSQIVAETQVPQTIHFGTYSLPSTKSTSSEQSLPLATSTLTAKSTTSMSDLPDLNHSLHHSMDTDHQGLSSNLPQLSQSPIPAAASTSKIDVSAVSEITVTATTTNISSPLVSRRQSKPKIKSKTTKPPSLQKNIISDLHSSNSRRFKQKEVVDKHKAKSHLVLEPVIYEGIAAINARRRRRFINEAEQPPQLNASGTDAGI